MEKTQIEHSPTVLTPSCESCGKPTRIYGIEPHLRLPHTDVNTYVCDACDTTQTLVVPLAAKAN